MVNLPKSLCGNKFHSRHRFTEKTDEGRLENGARGREENERKGRDGSELRADQGQVCEAELLVLEN